MYEVSILSVPPKFWENENSYLQIYAMRVMYAPRTYLYYSEQIFVVSCQDIFSGSLSSEKLCLILDSSNILSTDLLVSGHSVNVGKIAKQMKFIHLVIFFCRIC